MIKKIKSGDVVFYRGDFYTVEWVDDSGQTNLIGLKNNLGIIKVVSFSEEFILKTEEEM